MPCNEYHNKSDWRSVAGLPLGTYLLNYYDVDGLDYMLREIGQVRAEGNFGVASGLGEADVDMYEGSWAREPHWRVAVVPETPEHDRVTAFLAAAQMGVLDVGLLGSLMEIPDES